MSNNGFEDSEMLLFQTMGLKKDGFEKRQDL